MDDFIFYFKMGLTHVLDFTAYDHILFLIVLAVVFNINKWKKVLWLVSFFTIGHSITLALSAYGIVTISIELVEFLIPLTIFITAVLNIVFIKKTILGKQRINLVFALLFGLIHGLGFSNYFRMMIGREENKLLPLLEFAIGIEAAQIIIVLGILTLGVFLQKLVGVSRRDWILVTSAVVIGFAIQMMLDRVFW